jgi:thiol-disulfide isomerase/thioredoxin
MKKYVTTLLIVIYCALISAKPIQTRIDIEISGLENNEVTLASEYGIKELVIDTIRLDSLGKGFYESKSRLTGGIYLILLPNNKYFEFLINEEQFFTLSTDTLDVIGHLKIEGAEEPDLFRLYQQLTGKYNDSLKKNKDESAIFKNELKAHLNGLKDSIYTNLPGSYICKYLKMQDDPVIAELPTRSNDRPEPDFFKKLYNFKNQHYFDNIDFSDNRLLHTMLIGEKITYYFNVFVSNDADSLCKSIDRLVSLAKVNEEAYRFVLNIINVNFRNPHYSSQENALVYLADNYYLNGKAPWADKNFLKLFKVKVDKLRPSLIGAIAPNLIMQTVVDETFNLNDIKAKITILYFWSPDCNKCATETPKLSHIYEKYKNKSLVVIAVYTHADKQVWQDYIKQNNLDWVNIYDPLLKSGFSKLYNVQFTPKIVILDDKKKIIAKDITVEKIEKMLEKLLD